MLPLPNLIQPFVGAMGRIKAPWNFYLQQFTQAPPNVIDIDIGASPFLYTAVEPGNLSINGGTVTLVVLGRGNVAIDVSNNKELIAMSINDEVTVTYSVIPANIRFLPSYGQRTG